MPFEELHDQIQLALVLTNVMQLAEGWMDEPRRGSRLAPQAPLRRVAHVAKQFERDASMQPRVFRHVDDTHPADADPFADEIHAQLTAREAAVVSGPDRVCDR